MAAKMIDHFIGFESGPMLRRVAFGPTDEPPRLLLIQGATAAAAVLGRSLGELPARLQIAGDGEEGLALALAGHWDLIVIDLQLPGPGAFALCRAIRASGRTMPLLMLSSWASEFDRISSLELGADDCIDAPVSVPELHARARALLRRSAMQQRPALDAVLRFGPLVLDRPRRAASLAGKDLALAPREWRLLAFFAEHPCLALTRAELLDRVWGYGHDGYEHTVDSHINRLRAKLGDNRRRPRYIHTVWGTGYRFEPADPAR
jgi:DNA-binding response OmpR family regulator